MASTTALQEEQDSLIQERITLDPVTGHPILRNGGYRVRAVLIELLGADDGGVEALRLFPQLSREDLQAVERFYRLHRADSGFHAE